MTVERVNIVIADAYLGRFEAVVKRCVKAGLEVDQALKDIGVVSGRIDAGNRQRLRRVRGVAAVETDRELHIAPPGSEKQ
ncbi:MAG: hypothetical protein IT318_21270 [Anaerolineales bacterium]|nr:hypothetical protein [Anaerolineales bacterium]